MLHGAVTRYGKPAQTFSLIHADLHPRNVVINTRYAAVIDFDDTGSDGTSTTSRWPTSRIRTIPSSLPSVMLVLLDTDRPRDC